MSPSRGKSLVQAIRSAGKHNASLSALQRRATSSIPLVRLANARPRRVRRTESPEWETYFSSIRHMPSSGTKRSLHTLRQEAFGYPQWQTEYIDASLFEEEDDAYRHIIHGGAQESASTTQSEPGKLLLALLEADQLTEANRFLHDLKGLDTAIEPDPRFTQSALQMAQRGDWESAMAWLYLVPARDQQRRDATGEERIHSDEAKHLAEILQLSIEADKEQPDLVWQLLLFVYRMGYADLEGIDRASLEAMDWYMQHGRPSVCTKDKAPHVRERWTLKLWKRLVRSTDEYERDHLPSSSSGEEKVARRPHYRDGGGPFGAEDQLLNLAYNTSIRALCRAGRVDEATYWIKRSPTLLDQDQRAHQSRLLPARTMHGKLSPKTWKAYVVALFSVPGEVRAPLLDDFNSLVGRLKELREATGNDDRLPPRAVTTRQKAYQCLIELANTAGQGRRKAPRLGGDGQHVLLDPKQRMEILSRTSETHDELRTLLDKGEWQAGLRLYFARVHDPFLLGLVQTHLPYEWLTGIARSVEGRLSILPGDAIAAFALECLVEAVRQSPDRRTLLPQLYEDWWARRMGNEGHDEAPSAPSHRPRVNYGHMMVFLRKIPREFSYPIPHLEPPLLPMHEEAIRWCVRIKNDMHRAGLQPSPKDWTIVAECMARAWDGQTSQAEVAEQAGSDPASIFGPLRALIHRLQLDPAQAKPVMATDPAAQATEDEAEQRQIEEMFGQNGDMAVPTPFTYASLIRALLSVPPSRGGPLLDQARLLRSWFLHHPVAQRTYYQERDLYVGAVESALERLEAHEQRREADQMRATADHQRTGGDSAWRYAHLPRSSAWSKDEHNHQPTREGFELHLAASH